MEVGILSDTGIVREINQDDYLVHQNGYQMFLVADGMGGHSCGEVASQMAVDLVRRHASESMDQDVDPNKVIGILYEAFHQANRKILEYADMNRECLGMGTTLTMIWVQKCYGVIGHVGDSRIYMLRNKELIQLTEDHSLVAELFRKGEITKEEALIHPQKHVITRAMGIDETIRADFIPVELQAGDELLLCTDGITNLICDDELRNMLMRVDSAKDTAKAMVNLANERGGHDNSTVMIVRHLLSDAEGGCSY